MRTDESASGSKFRLHPAHVFPFSIMVSGRMMDSDAIASLCCVVLCFAACPHCSPERHRAPRPDAFP